jgi:hypothetical protein
MTFYPRALTYAVLLCCCACSTAADSNCLEVVETDAWRPGQEKPGSPGASPTP